MTDSHEKSYFLSSLNFQSLLIVLATFFVHHRSRIVDRGGKIQLRRSRLDDDYKDKERETCPHFSFLLLRLTLQPRLTIFCSPEISLLTESNCSTKERLSSYQ